jgi:hypothetical protein
VLIIITSSNIPAKESLLSISPFSRLKGNDQKDELSLKVDGPIERFADLKSIPKKSRVPKVSLEKTVITSPNSRV